MAEAKRIYSIFEKSHPEPAGDNKLDKQTLFFWATRHQPARDETARPEVRRCRGLIADFVNRRLVKSDAAKEWTWRERKFPYE